jgi:hypothetical protein
MDNLQNAVWWFLYAIRNRVVLLINKTTSVDRFFYATALVLIVNILYYEHYYHCTLFCVKSHYNNILSNCSCHKTILRIYAATLLLFVRHNNTHLNNYYYRLYSINVIYRYIHIHIIILYYNIPILYIGKQTLYCHSVVKFQLSVWVIFSFGVI